MVSLFLSHDFTFPPPCYFSFSSFLDSPLPYTVSIFFPYSWYPLFTSLHTISLFFSRFQFLTFLLFFVFFLFRQPIAFIVLLPCFHIILIASFTVPLFLLCVLTSSLSCYSLFAFFLDSPLPSTHFTSLITRASLSFLPSVCFTPKYLPYGLSCKGFGILLHTRKWNI